MNFPYVLIKFALSRDGYLDDASDKRLILSNEKDFAEVEEVRKSCDAILVGAETIRKDNPRLILTSGKKLTKVTITSSGNLDPKSNFFMMGESEKIVYTTNEIAEKLKDKLPNATIVGFPPCHSEQSEESQHPCFNIQFILEDLYKRGVKKLLVEGGATITTEFLKENLVDELQVSIAPRTLGDSNAPRISKEEIEHTLHLVSTKHLDEMKVLTYKPTLSSRRLKGGEISNEHDEISRFVRNDNNNDKKWIQYVIELSKKSQTSEDAFAVGAALVDKNDNLIVNGYSGELDPKMHAEEVIVKKLQNKQLDLSQTILYTSLEPCNKRLSKPKSCVDLILENGINTIVFAAKEPPIFVQGEGAERLKKEGKTVIKLVEYENEVIKIQSPGIQKKWNL